MANNGGTNSMRPRANTISHVDGATLGMIAAANSSVARTRPTNLGHSQHPSLGGLPGPGGFEFRGMSTATGHHGNPHDLPKLDTHGLQIDLSGSLRTAPAFNRFSSSHDMDTMMFGPGNTINPAHLHFTDTPSSMVYDSPASPFSQQFSMMPTHFRDEDSTFDWMQGFDAQVSLSESNEHAIAGSSPSAVSTGSPGPGGDVIGDGCVQSAQPTGNFPSSLLSQAPLMADYSMDMSSSPFTDNQLGPMSPRAMDFLGVDGHFSPPPMANLHAPTTTFGGLQASAYHATFTTNADTPTTAGSVGSSNRHSSVTSVSTDSITDATRQALIASLSQSSTFGQRKYTPPTSGSPLSPNYAGGPRAVNSISLPSTYDLQRYVAAYIQYFHPHLPFLHIPTLSFDSPAYTSDIRSMNAQTYHTEIVGGGGCLILAMAAIGALFEFDTAVSKELFDQAKRIIQLYLEERRKADMAAAMNGAATHADNSAQNTPLWLVQSMLLNVIYGHNCGDKTSAEIASTHCAALVSLARAAELAKPCETSQSQQVVSGDDIRMANDGWTVQGNDDSAWYVWKAAEEKKRTLFTVFILSSLLVSAYNHSPALTNSEIRLDLPCDEELWVADSAEAWYALGGARLANANTASFAGALSTLLTASQRQQHQLHLSSRTVSPPIVPGMGSMDMSTSELKVSTFGCLVLIYALHNYIWETRQRHLGRQWTTQETEAMHAHIEPALKAWQVAWSCNPHHSLERPNPFGLGPLSADSVPLLDLAYVRLFVNLGRSKEAFFNHDFDRMANEVARGAELVQHVDNTSYQPIFHGAQNVNFDQGDDANMLGSEHDMSGDPMNSGQSTKREKHLRKAAQHAAHSLSMSLKLGVSFADFNSRELPLAAALCTFDCTQVLAEWASTIQERVGRFLGVLGKDQIDYEAVPALMLVDQEDINLFHNIEGMLGTIEAKILAEANTMSNSNGMNGRNLAAGLEGCGYGSRIMRITARMLEKDAIWPGRKTYSVMPN